MTITVGFVGTGLIARIHLKGLLALHQLHIVDIDIIAVHDTDESRAAAFAAQCSAEGHHTVVVDSAAQVAQRCDAVWVCTPTAHHREAVEVAAANGCAIFGEKPLAISRQDCEAMVEAVERSGVIAQVGLVLRYAPEFIALADRLVDSQKHGHGRVMTVQFRDDQYLPNQGMYASTWRADVSLAGGGTLIEHSIHDLDALAWFCGPIQSISANMSCFAENPGIEDLAVLKLRHTSGVVSTLTSVWHQVLTRGSLRRIEAFCEHAVITFDDRVPQTIEIERSVGTEALRVESPVAHADQLPTAIELGDGHRQYALEDLAFLQSVRDGVAAAPGFRVALAAHAAADAAYRSASAHGAWVDVVEWAGASPAV